MSTIIDGKSLAAKLREELSKKIDYFKSPIGLAILLIGENTASQIYVNHKQKACNQVGIKATLHKLAKDISQQEVLKLLDSLNQDPQIHGIIVQLPLPPQLDSTVIINAISPYKDVDGLHPSNQLALYLNKKTTFVPCTPLGCLYLMEHTHPSLSGLSIAIIGRSHLVGKPLALLLLNRDCSVSILHSKSTAPQEISAQADIVISAAGIPHLVTSEWIKEGATVIDVGIHRLANGTLCGDVSYDEVKTKAGAITPVPGGVGPMTVVCLLENCYKAATNP